MMKKNHETPEFRVIRQNEANAKFFAASGGEDQFFSNGGTSPVVSMMSYGQSDANGLF